MTSHFAKFLPFCIIWGTLTALVVIKEARAPATDVFLFKEAGVNWALSGQFQAKNLPHMPEDESLLYSYYPPVYPFVFGVWTKLTGVGLKQSIAFDSLVRLLRTLALLALASILLKKLNTRTPLSAGVLGAFAILSFFSSDGDRPDELALFFGLSSLVAYFQGGHWRLLAGALLGLCGATSPAAGVLFASFVSLQAIFKKEWFRWFSTGLLAAFTFVLCNIAVILEGKSAIDRFLGQSRLSNFPYSNPINGISEFLSSYAHSFGHSVQVGWPYMLSYLFLLVGPLYWLKEAKNRNVYELKVLWGASGLFGLLCAVVWTLQPYYYWFAIVLLVLVNFGLAVSANRTGVASAAVVAIMLVPIATREIKSYTHGLLLPKDQRANVIAKKVLEIVDPDAKIAIHPDQYFTFRAHSQVDNVSYVCSHLEKYDYVYVTPKTNRLSRQLPTPIPCSKAGCFKLFADYSSREKLSMAGIEIPYYLNGNGGSLYKNTKCEKPS